MKRNSRKAISSVVIAALGLWLGLVSVAPTAHAFPVQGEESWSDTFDSTQGMKDFSQTKVAGETLEIGEPEPVDLGVPVPGESVLYTVLGTGLGESGNNVYCGTGEKGHLVEYSPDEVYQEGYCGPTHWGVSNSRGQPFPMPIAAGAEEQRMMSLTTDDVQYVYGGTGGTDPDGSLTRFEPYDGVGDPTQRAIADLGVAVAGGGDILALAYDGATSSVFGGTSNGYLFYYDGSFHNQGQPSGSDDDINALAVSGTTLFMGSQDGHLYTYTIGGPGGFSDQGQPSGSDDDINALAVSGTDLLIGSQDGHLYTYTIGGPGGFSDQGQPSGSDDDINALAVSGTDLLIGSANGHLYAFVIGGPGGFDDQGVPANSGGAPINALSLGCDGKVYGGTGDDGSGKGHLFRQSGFEDHGDPADPDPASPITGVTQQANVIYLSNQNGDLYSYSGPDNFNNHGQPDGTAINDIDATVGSVYLVTGGGSLYGYDNDTGLVDLGKPDPGDIASITAVLAHGSTVYVGLSDGRLYSHDGTDWSELLDTVPGGFAINDLAWKDALYVGASDGHLYSYNGSLTDHGAADGTAVNALSVYGTDVYLGLQGGDIYSWDGTSFSNRGPCGSAVRSLAPGNQCVLAGAEDGHLWVYDGSLRDAGTVPGLTAVRSLCRIGEHVFGGYRRREALLPRGRVPGRHRAAGQGTGNNPLHHLRLPGARRRGRQDIRGHLPKRASPGDRPRPNQPHRAGQGTPGQRGAGDRGHNRRLRRRGVRVHLRRHQGPVQPGWREAVPLRRRYRHLHRQGSASTP